MIIRKVLHPEVAAIYKSADEQVEEWFYSKIERALYDKYHNEQRDRVQREDSSV